MKHITLASLVLLNAWIVDFNIRVAGQLHIVPQPDCSITTPKTLIATAPFACAPISSQYEQYLTASESATLVDESTIASWVPQP